jgi:hypothetical protein
MVQRRSVGNLGNEMKVEGGSGLGCSMHLVANLLGALFIPTLRMRLPPPSPLVLQCDAYQPNRVNQVNIWQ